MSQRMHHINDRANLMRASLFVCVYVCVSVCVYVCVSVCRH
jgi:hypothetical protein